MINNNNKWEKLGKLISSDLNSSWMTTFTGPSFLLPRDKSNIVDILITGRDDKNRSLIGCVTINIETQEILEISKEPIFSVGDLGAFDENGVSYPCIVKDEKKLFMYYVGWMPTVLTPFQNYLGLAIADENEFNFKRYSKAPVLDRNNDDPISIGSSFVMIDDGKWKMWYTSFLKWGEKGEHKHYYVIKYAESDDGITWNRENKICINIEADEEYSICRPSVLKIDGNYHMWYVYRGKKYKLGYASSENGVKWSRKDDIVNISISKHKSWDSIDMSYPHVIKHEDYLYMVYCGNEYGKEGLGLAKLKL